MIITPTPVTPWGGHLPGVTNRCKITFGYYIHIITTPLSPLPRGCGEEEERRVIMWSMERNLDWLVLVLLVSIKKLFLPAIWWVLVSYYTIGRAKFVHKLRLRIVFRLSFRRVESLVVQSGFYSPIPIARGRGERGDNYSWGGVDGIEVHYNVLFYS